MLSFLMGPYDGKRRANMLVGTLFAVLVNQRVTESVIGRTEAITLIDKIHLIAMVYIFLIALAGIYSEWLLDQGRKEEADRNEVRGLWVAAVSYVVVNAIVVGAAAIRG
jgi:membrane-anchored protein YejM (alkaline phosphatase superfamily)